MRMAGRRGVRGGILSPKWVLPGSGHTVVAYFDLDGDPRTQTTKVCLTECRAALTAVLEVHGAQTASTMARSREKISSSMISFVAPRGSRPTAMVTKVVLD